MTRAVTRSSFAVLALALAVGAAAPAAAETGSITGKVDCTPPKYLPETVVYLKAVPGAAVAPKTVAMDQKGLTFIPHVVVVAKGDTVKFLNHDKVAHNVYSPDLDAYNLGTFKPEEARTKVFDQEGPYTQLCSIHPEMLAYIYVAPTSFAAAVDAKGSYTIKDVPPGTYKIAIWNATLKAADKSVTVAAGKASDVPFALKR